MIKFLENKYLQNPREKFQKVFQSKTKKYAVKAAYFLKIYLFKFIQHFQNNFTTLPDFLQRKRQRR